MLTVKEIETKTFSKVKGGYSPDEVDNFLDEILEDYDRFLEEKANYEKKISILNQTIETLKKQKAAPERQNLSSNLIENAQTKAEKLVNDAQDYAKKLIEAVKIEAENQKLRTEKLNKEVADFKANLLSIYENHVKLISSIPEINGFSSNLSEMKDLADSDSLELLKSATTDIAEESLEEPQPEEPEKQTQPNEENDPFGDVIPDMEPELNKDEVQIKELGTIIGDDDDEDDDDIQIRQTVKSRRQKAIAAKVSEELENDSDNDDEDYIDFEDFDEEDDEKGSAFGSLFGNKKAGKEKEKKKKKHHFFNVEDDDDDFDDDFDDDDDF